MANTPNSKTPALFEQSWRATISERQESQLLRRHRILQSPQQVELVVDGRAMLGFCSNDYLGLANHPEVKQAAIDSIAKNGLGSGASHLVNGHHDEHEHLASELAAFTGRDRALVFSSGYMANMAVVSSLVGKGDYVFQDKLNHASLIDGGLMSGARFQRYLHNDTHSLATYLNKYADLTGDKERTPKRKMLVVSDGVFSMDGDVADLKTISSLCTEHQALLMVDDAHGLGVLGEGGRGSVTDAGLGQNEVPVLVGTFGKAFGTSGAFVAGPEAMIEYLIQVARPYIYTTAMPIALASATRASLSLIKQADARRSHLASLISYFRLEANALGYQLMDSQSPIQPILIGSSEDSLRLSDFLASQGILVAAIRPPTVPANTSRLRVTFSASHELIHVERLLDALSLAIDLGVISHGV